MADNELAQRLARRQNIIEGNEEAPAENIEAKCNQVADEDKSTVDSADNELAQKLKRWGLLQVFCNVFESFFFV